MTIDEFLQVLSAKPYKWEYRFNKTAIRTTCGHCPISAYTGEREDYRRPILAGKTFGLSDKDARAVFDAADFSVPFTDYFREVREKLIQYLKPEQL